MDAIKHSQPELILGIEPYYHDVAAGIAVYHGDCRELLPQVAFGVMVTDPPFGMDWESGFQGVRGTASIRGDEDSSLRDWLVGSLNGRPAIIFGTWKVARPANLTALLVWDKGPHVGAGNLAVPWKPNTEEIYILGHGFNGHRGSSVLQYNAPSPNFVDRLHPAEKPLGLLQDLVGKCPLGLIVDPCAGSGTTLCAAKLYGRRAIGIEIESKYCEIAANRLRQGVFDFRETKPRPAVKEAT